MEKKTNFREKWLDAFFVYQFKMHSGSDIPLIFSFLILSLHFSVFLVDLLQSQPNSALDWLDQSLLEKGIKPIAEFFQGIAEPTGNREENSLFSYCVLGIMLCFMIAQIILLRLAAHRKKISKNSRSLWKHCVKYSHYIYMIYYWILHSCLVIWTSRLIVFFSGIPSVPMIILHVFLLACLVSLHEICFLLTSEHMIDSKNQLSHVYKWSPLVFNIYFVTMSYLKELLKSLDLDTVYSCFLFVYYLGICFLLYKNHGFFNSTMMDLKSFGVSLLLGSNIAFLFSNIKAVMLPGQSGLCYPEPLLVLLMTTSFSLASIKKTQKRAAFKISKFFGNGKMSPGSLILFINGCLKSIQSLENWEQSLFWVSVYQYHKSTCPDYKKKEEEAHLKSLSSSFNSSRQRSLNNEGALSSKTVIYEQDLIRKKTQRIKPKFRKSSIQAKKCFCVEEESPLSLSSSNGQIQMKSTDKRFFIQLLLNFLDKTLSRMHKKSKCPKILVIYYASFIFVYFSNATLAFILLAKARRSRKGMSIKETIVMKNLMQKINKNQIEMLTADQHHQASDLETCIRSEREFTNRFLPVFSQFINSNVELWEFLSANSSIKSMKNFSTMCNIIRPPHFKKLMKILEKHFREISRLKEIFIALTQITPKAKMVFQGYSLFKIAINDELDARKFNKMTEGIIKEHSGMLGLSQKDRILSKRSAVLRVSGLKKSFGDIVWANSNATQLLKVPSNALLLESNIYKFLPYSIAGYHDVFIQRYYKGASPPNGMLFTMRKAFVVTLNRVLVPVFLYVKPFLQIDGAIQFSSLFYKPKKAKDQEFFYIMTDKNGVIDGFSKNLYNKIGLSPDENQVKGLEIKEILEELNSMYENRDDEDITTFDKNFFSVTFSLGANLLKKIAFKRSQDSEESDFGLDSRTKFHGKKNKRKVVEATSVNVICDASSSDNEHPLMFMMKCDVKSKIYPTSIDALFSVVLEIRNVDLVSDLGKNNPKSSSNRVATNAAMLQTMANLKSRRKLKEKMHKTCFTSDFTKPNKAFKKELNSLLNGSSSHRNTFLGNVYKAIFIFCLLASFASFAMAYFFIVNSKLKISSYEFASLTLNHSFHNLEHLIGALIPFYQLNLVYKAVFNQGSFAVEIEESMGLTMAYLNWTNDNFFSGFMTSSLDTEIETIKNSNLEITQMERVSLVSDLVFKLKGLTWDQMIVEELQESDFQIENFKAVLDTNYLDDSFFTELKEIIVKKFGKAQYFILTSLAIVLLLSLANVVLILYLSSLVDHGIRFFFLNNAEAIAKVTDSRVSMKARLMDSTEQFDDVVYARIFKSFQDELNDFQTKVSWSKLPLIKSNKENTPASEKKTKKKETALREKGQASIENAIARNKYSPRKSLHSLEDMFDIVSIKRLKTRAMADSKQPRNFLKGKNIMECIFTVLKSMGLTSAGVLLIGFIIFIFFVNDSSLEQIETFVDVFQQNDEQYEFPFEAVRESIENLLFLICPTLLIQEFEDFSLSQEICSEFLDQDYTRIKEVKLIFPYSSALKSKNSFSLLLEQSEALSDGDFDTVFESDFCRVFQTAEYFNQTERVLFGEYCKELVLEIPGSLEGFLVLHQKANDLFENQIIKTLSQIFETSFSSNSEAKEYTFKLKDSASLEATKALQSEEFIDGVRFYFFFLEVGQWSLYNYLFYGSWKVVECHLSTANLLLNVYYGMFCAEVLMIMVLLGKKVLRTRTRVKMFRFMLRMLPDSLIKVNRPILLYLGGKKLVKLATEA